MPKKIQKKKKNKTEPQVQETRPKDFLDLIAPAAVKFNTDHYICGSLYHCTLALRSYPATTEELALLRHLGEKSGVTLSIYTRQVTAAEENGILHNAENKNRMARSSTNSMKAAVTARGQPPGCGGAHRRHAEEPGASDPLRGVHRPGGPRPGEPAAAPGGGDGGAGAEQAGDRPAPAAPTGRIPLIQPHGPQHFQEPV